MTDKAGARHQAAFIEAKQALDDAHVQGIEGKDLSDNALTYALLGDKLVATKVVSTNSYRDMYRIGAEIRAGWARK